MAKNIDKFAEFLGAKVVAQASADWRWGLWRRTLGSDRGEVASKARTQTRQTSEPAD